MIMKKKLIFILSIGFTFGVADAASSREKVNDILNKIPKSVDMGDLKKILSPGPKTPIPNTVEIFNTPTWTPVIPVSLTMPTSSPVTTENGWIAIEIGKSGVTLSDLFKKSAKTSVGESSLVDKYRASANSSKVDRSIRNYAHSARENERVFSKSSGSASKRVKIKGIFDIIIEERDGYLVPKIVNLETEKKGTE